MTEAAPDGGAPEGFDLAAAKLALSSSSTSIRIAQLRSVEEKLSQNGIFQTCQPQVSLFTNTKCAIVSS